MDKNQPSANPDLGGISRAADHSGSGPDESLRRETLRLVPDSAGLARAGALLREGKLVAFPTETVYGLGADATQAPAIAALYAAKGRPQFNPLIAHVAHLEDAKAEGLFNETAEALARAFWPGPLTLVVPRNPQGRVCDLACAGLTSIGLRLPSHPIARGLIEQAGHPIAAPSANRSGHVSPTTPDHVWDDLNSRIDAVVEGFASPVGVESTIIACLEDAPVLLRHGGITREMIEACLGHAIIDSHDLKSDAPSNPMAPGMLESHYAPKAPVRLAAETILPHEAVLLFGPVPPAGMTDRTVSLNLSPRGDLTEAAANLYAYLRRLDTNAIDAIAVAPIPAHGLGAAINDRLRRAAAPRPSNH